MAYTFESEKLSLLLKVILKGLGFQWILRLILMNARTLRKQSWNSQSYKIVMAKHIIYNKYANIIHRREGINANAENSLKHIVHRHQKHRRKRKLIEPYFSFTAHPPWADMERLLPAHPCKQINVIQWAKLALFAIHHRLKAQPSFAVAWPLAPSSPLRPLVFPTTMWSRIHTTYGGLGHNAATLA